MKVLVVIALLGVAAARPGARHRREAYLLPDGAELLLGTVKTTFKCPSDGYFADVDNDCKVFHICHDAFGPEGAVGHEMQQFSFLCGNQTMFNQLSLTCAYEDDAVPCENAKDFYYLNANIGDPKAEFLSDNDIQRAAPLVPSLKAHGAGLSAGPAQAPPAVVLAPGLVRPPSGGLPRTPPRGLGRGAASELKEVTVTAPPTTPSPPSTTQKEE
ncbi:hypothetical protein V5799_015675 [Amblyomma americanum]|uniref:Chitin-binding type-2 domain-containing protein n=1 Tax=Amblyomma americanum TaxID=6943 RepID=A0AAQ4F753_AMBAM